MLALWLAFHYSVSNPDFTPESETFPPGIDIQTNTYTLHFGVTLQLLSGL